MHAFDDVRRSVARRNAFHDHKRCASGRALLQADYVYETEKERETTEYFFAFMRRLYAHIENETGVRFHSPCRCTSTGFRVFQPYMFPGWSIFAAMSQVALHRDDGADHIVRAILTFGTIRTTVVSTLFFFPHIQNCIVDTQKRFFSSRRVVYRVRSFAAAFAPMQLPLYVLLDIFDWLEFLETRFLLEVGNKNEIDAMLRVPKVNAIRRVMTIFENKVLQH